jgi:hypothetical protein
VKKVFAAGVLIFVLAACSNFVQPTPTPIPTQTFTALPTLTPSRVPTHTPVPPTATPEIVATRPGEAASEWNGIPIMPEATSGGGDAEGYVFTIQATSQQIQEFYEMELGKLGWQLFGTGDGSSSQMLIFTNEAAESLSINILTKGDEALVLLVK